MENPMEWITSTLWLITVINAIITLGGGIGRIIEARNRPEEQQNLAINELRTEITSIKRILEEYAEYFDNDDKRIETLEEGNKVTQKMLLALARHSIDGNHIDELQKASDDLNNYLIHK